MQSAFGNSLPLRPSSLVPTYQRIPRLCSYNCLVTHAKRIGSLLQIAGMSLHFQVILPGNLHQPSLEGCCCLIPVVFLMMLEVRISFLVPRRHPTPSTSREFLARTPVRNCELGPDKSSSPSGETAVAGSVRWAGPRPGFLSLTIVLLTSISQGRDGSSHHFLVVLGLLVACALPV